MSTLLVVDPRQYVVDFIGYKNEFLLKVAMEVYVAENSLSPSFSILDEKTKREYRFFNNRCLELYKREHASSFNGDVLNIIYFLHYINFLANENVVHRNKADFLEYVGYDLLKTLYEKEKLESNVARLMFRTNEFYNKMFGEKTKSLDEFFSGNNHKDIDEVKSKILGAMIIQNKELYELEKERLNQYEDYEIFNKYRKNIEDGYKSICRKVQIAC